MRTIRLLTAAGAAAVLLLASSPGAAWAQPEAAVRHNAKHPVPGAYMVVLKAGAVSTSDTQSTAAAAVARYGGRLHSVYTRTMSGYAVEGLSEKAARQIAARPEVAWVAQSGTAGVGGVVTQPNPPNWGLDRIDQRDLPLNREYRYDDTAQGQGVNIYIVDTGIRYSHSEFGGRAKFGTDLVSPSTNGSDCHGHGSHVSGIAAGRSFGVAKQANLWSVRVLGCNGFGQDIDVARAAEWVTANAVKPAVANLSVYTDDPDIAASAIRQSVQSGVQWSLITGNNGGNACNYGPGGQVGEALQVGNVTSNDTKAGDSNYGTCMDLHAPGSNIVSAYHTSDTATTTLSGTSMAAPHVAGAIATHLTKNPGATSAQVHSWVMGNATDGTLSNLPAGTPNKMLYIPVDGTQPPGDFSLAANPASATVQAGSAASTTISATENTVAPQVVGGEPTTVQQYPFMISQRREGSSFPGQQSCSSTLMGPRTVLTAAHCLLESGGRKWYVYGATNLNEPGFTAEIARQWVHPNYVSWREGYDVAVVTLDRDVLVPAGIAYPTLNTDPALEAPGTIGLAIGWGRTGANTYSDVLRRASVPVAPDLGCRNRYTGQYKVPAMICTGYADGHAAACVGDSGGPFLVGSKIVGVFSWMSTACDWYAVYARVSTYAAEIQAQLPGGNPPTGDITLSASGLPSGATASFNPNTISVGGSSALTVSTSASTPAGTYTITVTGTKGTTSAQTTFTLTVTGGPSPTPLALQNPGTQTSYVGRPVSLAMRASGGTTPYRFSATGLPTGLTINQSTGVVSGTPSVWQNAHVTVTVTDARGATARVSFYWFIFPY